MITTPPDGYADAAHDLDAAEDAEATRLLRITDRLATGAEVVRDVRETRLYGGQLVGQYINASTAKAIASWWQAPRGVGSVLASFASGALFDPNELLADVFATQREQGYDKAARRSGVERSNVLQLDALASYVVGVLHAGR